MKKISILTATRAEYGLLKPVLKRLSKVNELDMRIVVTGMHLSPEFGLTYQEIIQDGYEIDKKIEMLLSSDTPISTSKSMGLALISFGEYFEELKPDLLLVLGDRYETLAVCCAAMNARIPIAHLYGGETTEGAVDESIRHAITKMSYLHFTSTEDYRRRVIQLGEDPNRVINVGGLGIENIKNAKLLSKNELEVSLGIQLDMPYAVVTYHPVTFEENNVKDQFYKVLKALDEKSDYLYIITKANADTNGRIINKLIDQYVRDKDNAVAFTSLGMVRYLSALKYCSMVIGNSSSGILEAPAFNIPTINIGDRQKGRIQCNSIINCKPNEQDIIKAIDIASNNEFRKNINSSVNPYGDGKASERIVKSICCFMDEKLIDLKKKFYDIEFNI